MPGPVLQPDRYLVWWYSRVAGELGEKFAREEQAKQRLDELEEREHFVRGVVVDLYTAFDHDI
jgi:hypothetical protein